MNPGLIILLAIGLYYFTQQNKTGSTITVSNLSTDQKRAAIINYWQTTTPPNNQISDNGRFIDILQNISGSEIDTIYSYVFDYVAKGIRPATESILYNQIQVIINEYNIFT